MVLLLESALFGMFVSAILIDQMQAILGDETAIEQMQHQGPYRKHRRPRLALLSEVCGRTHPILWLFPFTNSSQRYQDTPLLSHDV